MGLVKATCQADESSLCGAYVLSEYVIIGVDPGRRDFVTWNHKVPASNKLRSRQRTELERVWGKMDAMDADDEGRPALEAEIARLKEEVRRRRGVMLSTSGTVSNTRGSPLRATTRLSCCHAARRAEDESDQDEAF